MTARNLRTYTIALTAGQSSTLSVSGNMFSVVEASGEFTLIFDESNRFAKQSEGMGARFTQDYSKVEIMSSSSQTVTIVMGFGAYDSATVNASVNVTTEPANTSPATSDVSIPATTTTQVLAPSGNRKRVHIFAGETNIENLRIGCHSGVGASDGGILAPGGNGELETTTGVWVYNPGAAAETVTVIDLERT